MAFLEDVAYQLLIAIVVTLVLGVLVYLFRRRVRLQLRRWWYYLTNKRVTVSLTLVRKYSGPIMKPLSHEVYSALKSKVKADTLALRSVSTEAMTVESKILGLEIELEFAPEFDVTTIEAETPKVIDFKLVVHPRTGMRWGRRDTDELSHLGFLMDKMAETAETLCLRQGERPIQEFLLVDYEQSHSPVGQTPEELRDKDLNVQLTVDDGTVRAVLEGTERLVVFARRNIPS